MNQKTLTVIHPNNMNEHDTLLCPCQTFVIIDNNHKDNDCKNSDISEYTQCCQPYHNYDKLPETAEQLMKSRYSAFVLHEIDYIIETTLPMQQKLLDKQSISDWSEQTDWAGLQIVNHTPVDNMHKTGRRHAQVEFKAWINTADGKQYHHELSAFVKVPVNKQPNKENHKKRSHKDKGGKKIGSDKWYFIDPIVDINVPQKQPCICGSGEKFKRCCGVFLSF